MSILAYKEYIFYSVRAKLINQTSQNHLGLFWWILEPILQMIVYYYVFSVLLNRRTEEFTSLLLIGITTWSWFAQSVSNGANSIIAARKLMTQVQFSKTILPHISILVSTVRFILVFIILVSVLCCKNGCHNSLISLPTLILSQLFMIYAITTLIAAIVPFIPDLKYFVVAGLSAMMFCSGVFFEITPDNENYQLMMMNPMAKFLEQYRVVLLDGLWPDWYFLVKSVCISIPIYILASKFINKMDHFYPRLAK